MFCADLSLVLVCLKKLKKEGRKVGPWTSIPGFYYAIPLVMFVTYVPLFNLCCCVMWFDQ